MNRILIASLFGVLVFVAAALVSIKPTTTARVWADGGIPCSLRSAAGNWSFTDTGNVVSPPLGPRVAAGRLTLDDDGHVLNGAATSSLNGNVAPETFSGTYTVNPDCTGTINVTIFNSSGSELFAVGLNTAFDDNMHELRGLFTSVADPNGNQLQTVIALDARKQ